jgi:plastocyanin
LIFFRAMPASRVCQAALLLAALVTGAADDGAGSESGAGGESACGSACTDICAPELSDCAVGEVLTEVSGTCVCQSPAPAYSANDISDIIDFVSGVDSLGFSGAPADHCQGGDATVSFRYQPPTDPAEPLDTRSFTAATLKAHLDTLEAGSVNLKVVCDFGSGQSASDDFTVTITCGAADVDGDGVCDHNDACAGVQCQAFYAHLPQAGSTIQFAAVDFSQYNINDGTNVNIEICAGTHTVERTDGAHPLKILNSHGIAGIIEGNADLPIAFVAGEPYNYECTTHSNMHGDITVVDCASPYTCVDTGSAADDYQCREDPDDANDECGGRGFTGSNCEVCAAGSGWNGDDADPQCVACGAPEHTASTSAGEQCSAVNCDPGQGVLTDFKPAASDNCDVCGEGYYSAGGDASCQQCPLGYTPTNDAASCEDIDECAPAPCQNGAMCNDGENSYTCGCQDGYTGKNCQCYPGEFVDPDMVDDGSRNVCADVDECDLHPCQNGAMCVESNDDSEVSIDAYRCVCPPGYNGLSCENNIDECAPAPCQNGATCTDGENSYTCECPDGHTGKNCQCYPGEFVDPDMVDDGSRNVCADVDECDLYPCQNGGVCYDSHDQSEISLDAYMCDCNAIDYSGDRCQTRTDNCNPDPCKNGATCSDHLNDYECSPARGFSGKDNDVCADGKQEVSNICMTKRADGKAPAGDITLVKSLHGGTAPAQRKARKQAVRDALREARKDVDDALLADKKKGGQQAVQWLKEYAVELDEDNDYADGSATKAKFKALPAESTLKMVVGFEGDSEVVVSARPRNSKKGEPVHVQRVVLADRSSVAVLGIESADGTDPIKTAKFTGIPGASEGYRFQCYDDNAGGWGAVVEIQDEDTAECPIARGEPVARTFLVGSLEEDTTACKQDNALNYMGTAIYHNQILCCVVDGCSKQQLSDAFAAKSSGCGDNAGDHAETCVLSGTSTVVGCDATDADGTCQTEHCTQAQLFDAYESGTCARR